MRTTKGGEKDHRKRKSDKSKWEEMRATDTLTGRRRKMKTNRKIKEAAASPDGRYFPPLPKISTAEPLLLFPVHQQSSLVTEHGGLV